MGEINFAVLKINGKNIQKLSKDEALQAFMSTNPFHIEIQQCRAIESIVASNSKSFVLSLRCIELQNKQSQQSQTDLSIESVRLSQCIEQIEEEDDHGGNTVEADKERLIEEEHVLFDQCLAPEIDIEEVTLRKSSSNEQLGLSIIYSGAPDGGTSSKTNSGGSNNGATTNSTIGSGSEYNNENCTEVFISHIQTDSVAWRDGRLRQGDQILQINGKEIKTKEETETLIAENNNAVTLLVSRYLYTDEDDFNDPSLADLVEVEVVEDDDNDETDDDDDDDERAEGGIYTDSNLAYENCPNDKQNLNLISNLKTDIVEQDKTYLPIATETKESSAIATDKINTALSTGVGSSFDNKEQSLVSETCRKDVRSVSKVQNERQEKSVKVRNDCASNVVIESDTEHIYETIPEDSESEPFYCSPYESSTYVNAVGTCSSSTSLNGNGEAFQLQQRQKQRVAQWLGLMHPSSASVTVHQHEPEDNNSSSAYNTGGSNGSAKQQQQQQQHMRSDILGAYATSRNLQDENFLTNASYNKRFQKPKIKANQNSSGFNTTVPHLNAAGNIIRTGCEEFSIPDTLIRMYPPLTPITGNQQIPSKKLSNRETAPRLCNKTQITDQLPRTVSMLCPHFNAPSLRQYHFVSSQEVSSSHLNAPNLDTVKTQPLPKQVELAQQKQQQQPSMVWKVKRRPDGTRYIVRRPAAANAPSNEASTSVLVGRNRILRNSEHVRNDFTTTEDDTISEVKTGRYWPKEERKKHVERARERRQQQQQHQQQQLIEAATTIRISDKMVARLQQYRKQRQKQQLSTVKIQHQDLQFGGGTEVNLKTSCDLQSAGVSVISKTMTPNAISKISTLQSQQLPQQQLHFINNHSHVQSDGLTTASLIPIEDINPKENCSSP